jgi:hypothetical protein
MPDIAFFEEPCQMQQTNFFIHHHLAKVNKIIQTRILRERFLIQPGVKCGLGGILIKVFGNK